MLFYAVVLCATPASAATLPVGPGQPYGSPCAAIAAAQPGDVIELDSTAAWIDDFCLLSKENLTIRSVGPGRARVGASGRLPLAGGAMWVVAASGITIEGVEFDGAVGGAALRTEMGFGVRLKSCLIHSNEIGLLVGEAPAAEVVVENCEFAGNAAGHVQAGRAARLLLQYNYIHHTGGITLRAAETHLLYNRITQENGEGGFGIEFPEGGRAWVMGNLLHHRAVGGAEAILSYGKNADPSGGGLYLVHNTFVDERAERVFLALAEPERTRAVVKNNIFDNGGSGQVEAEEAFGGGNYWGDARFVDRSNYDFRLEPDSPAINAGVSLEGMPVPEYEYSHPVSGEERRIAGVVDRGAYEYGSAAGLPGAGSARTAKRVAVLAGIEPRAAAPGTVALTLSSATAAAGATVTLNISMAATDTRPAGLQWTLAYVAADFTSVSVAAGPSATAAGKTIACAGSAGSYTCLLYGIDGNTIGDGVVAVATLRLAASPSGSTLPVQLTNGVSASLIGEEIATTTAGAVVTVQPPAGVSVTVSPTTATLAASQTRQFTATVTGTTNTAVTWSVTGAGSISTAGLYTAPATITTTQTVTVRATSQADTTKSATATVTLQPTVAATTTIVLQQGLNGYPGATDTYIDKFSPNSAPGTRTYTITRQWGENKALVRFDLSSIPAQATIQSAALELYVYNQGSASSPRSGTVEVHRILPGRSWISGQTTWNIFRTGATWTAAGMRSGSDYDSQIAGTIQFLTTDAVGWKSADITSLVRQWLGGTENNGAVLLITTGNPHQKFYYSSEYGTLSLRPKLTVRYSIT